MTEERTSVEPNNVSFNGWDCNPERIGAAALEEAQVGPERRRSIILSAASKKKFSASRSHKLRAFFRRAPKNCKLDVWILIFFSAENQ